MPAIHRPHDTALRFATQFGSAPVPVGVALAAGFTEGQVRAALQRGLLVRSRHGVIQLVDTVAGHDPRPDWLAMRLRHIDAVRAALAAVGPGAFATYDSAALVIDCPRAVTTEPTHVSLCIPGVPDYTGPGLVVRGSPISDRFVTVVDGIPTTDVRRTAVDLARGRSLWSALTPLDAASRLIVARQSGAHGNDLRRAVRDPALARIARAELEYALEAITGWPGVVAARRALRYATPAAESPAESRSRGWFLAAGIASLDVGVPIPVGRRTYWADFCDEKRRVIGEADGWIKYGDDLESFRRTLSAEKVRQSDLEGDGWRFLRWMSDDPRRDVVSRMHAALRSA